MAGSRPFNSLSLAFSWQLACRHWLPAAARLVPLGFHVVTSLRSLPPRDLSLSNLLSRVRGQAREALGEIAMARLAAVLVAACVVFQLAFAASASIRGPPRGPWRGSRGKRETLRSEPLLASCKERWRPTRLDHFRWIT